jgi:hypothetical protein
MEAAQRRTLAILEIVLGWALLIVALWLHLVIPGLAFALMIMGGIMLVFSGFMHR